MKGVSIRSMRTSTLGACLLALCGLVMLTSVAPAEEPAASFKLHVLQQREIKDLRVGERYPGGTRVRSPFFGLSFVVPPEWRASLPAGSVVFLDSAVRPGLGTVHFLSEVSRKDVVAGLSEPQALEAGFVLHPTGMIKEDGNRLSAAYAAGEDIGVTVVVLGPDRNAVVYQFVGRKTEQDLYRRLAEELAASTEFMSLGQLRALRAWYERLSGMMLMPKRSADSNQRSASPTIHLCSDGRFITIMKLTPVPGRESKPETEEEYHETGTWRIEVQDAAASLILTKATGGDRSYVVREETGKILLDGQLASVELSTSCF